MPQVLDPPTEAMSSVSLDKNARCDGCGAQAFVQVLLKSQRTLLFCKHHAKKHALALKDAEATIVTDESGTINLKPTDPSGSQGF